MTLSYNLYKPCLAAFLLSMLLFSGLVWARAGSDEWYEGPDGYKQAYAQHQKTGDPLLLYFYAPWCGYCRKLDQTLLVNAQVKSFLRSYIKVRVYSEATEAGRQLANKLGVRGFPDMHVWYKNACNGEVSPFRYDARNDTWAMASPSVFIRSIENMCHR